MSAEKAEEMEISREEEEDDDDHKESEEEGSTGDHDDNSGFVPSIKIKRMEGSILISTVVVKDVALTSALFKLLEEEKLDIAFENQYRTETKVAHTIQVKVPQGYDIDALETKLCAWAGKHT